MAQIIECPSSGDGLFSIDNDRYIVPHSTSDIFLNCHDDFSLVTVFNVSVTSNLKITGDWVRERVQTYKKSDDVFQESFLAGVVFLGASEDEVEITDEAREYLSRSGNQWMKCICPLNNREKVLPGPYVLLGNRLRDVWKLVDDKNGTCMTTFRPQSGSFEPLQLKSSDDQFLGIALSSRIKSQANSESAIAGWRVIIKDNIHLRAVKTSVGNRAFYDTYPPQTETAECVQRLIDRGVTIIGKAKMNSFGNWEEPTEYIDYQAPWNPRADRYQSPGGSSSGSASAIAAYDWLDIAVGTDTWGSVTRPALWCGCFGLRPSIGAVSPNGVEPYVPAWDTPGLLGRDLAKCRKFASAWLRDEALTKNPKPFTAIVWPTDFWGIVDPDQCTLARQFMKDIESQLNLQHSDISFEKAWSTSPPSRANGLSLSDYINPATSGLAYDVYRNCDDFRRRYWDKFHQAPYTSCPKQRLWEAGKTISKKERDNGFDRIAVYESWFKSTILVGNLSNALIVLPLESMSPRYRDQSPAFKRPPQDGINALALAPVMKSPALAIPIGEISYKSKITENLEKLPFAVAVMSSPGTDLKLMETMEVVLKGVGRPTCVKTGKVMFESSGMKM